MTGEAGALGELVGGAMIASQFDGPATAQATAAGSAGHGACANCAHTLYGHFCSHCGQAAHVTRSVAHLVEELLHGLTHFDGKAWRTLPALVFRPGRLTYDYIHGKRARYIAPMALFLFTVFLMFFVFGLLGGPDIDGALARANAPGQQRALLAAEARLAAPPAPAPAAATHVRWQDQLAESVRSGKLHINAATPAITARVRTALLNPDLALYRIQEKAYKLSFLLVPLSFPVLWLMFCRRRDVRSFDHIVFALYSLSFMSLLTVVFALLAGGSVIAGVADGWAGGIPQQDRSNSLLSNLGGALMLVPPVHMFFQLKGAYRLRVGGALWRTAVLGVSSLITLGLFASVIILVGLAD